MGKKINKIKRWIVYKLGGMMIEDVSLNLQQKILNYWTNKTIDQNASRVFIGGFNKEEGFWGKGLGE